MNAPESPDYSDTTLAVLAGGAGVRMGAPKGLLEIHGEPVLSRLLNRLQWPGPTLLVMSPGRAIPPGAKQFDKIACDAEPNQGPLRGCLTAVESSTTPYLIIVPVDMPGLERAPLIWLANELKQHRDIAILMMSRQLEGQPPPQVEPMPLALRRPDAIPILAQRLAQQRRSLHGLVKHDGVRVVPSPAEWSETFWTNLNEPGDLKKFESDPGSSLTSR